MSKVGFIKDEIKDQYLIDDRPWIVGFSGGKDSSTLLQLVWYALKELPKSKLKKEVHIVANDTLVENPKVVAWLDSTLEKIEEAAKKEKLPFKVIKTTPELENSFWVNLIGKGYPAPNSTFRWCTERLKITPTTKYIKDQVGKHGEVVVLLGTREDESSSRKRSIDRRQILNERLSRHPQLELAYVYSPIKSLETEELWQYLLQVPSPYNASNRELVTLYKNATGGECPLVIDTTTSSCGNSRFGCWVCTVVKKDKSMEALVDNGEEWLEPLLDLRDWLYENRDKEQYRMPVRRNGAAGTGPYNIETRELILSMLLKAQKDSGERLITTQELKSIQILWTIDGYSRSVFDIYNRVFGSEILHTMNKRDSIKKKHKEELNSLCERNQVDHEVLERLLSAEKDKRLLRKRADIKQIIKSEISNIVS
ncbi:DNA phosphorothioation system sulfurtransferase DndC [Flaviaesturariibacter aridisoli]|uniref:DNA phosphorothioation system sulfurtransferase DndC n=1 Tax=Flaviaesturariibacter aridisoli TaxID=2545761 RepID=A0A4R4E3E2_9BACT|nr:DNA phosphorothioation system sulfurtransferase DndC [Flaviaesturariibacter aridisoli]TCZ74064.1 DNA phosphorothioation system sulfurtransferase DndC [Flaviaesturariibacter aridisoli]